VWRAQWLEAACAREQLQQQLGTAPTAAQLVAALGITLEEVAELDQWLEELVQEHARLVDAIVQRVVRQTGYRGERADLRQVGWEGLVQAAHKFDPARGVGFSTYATPRIRGAILDYLRQAALIRVPRPRPTATIREELAEFARARAQLRQQLGSAPTAAQLAAALDRSIEEVKELEKLEDRYKRREFRVRPLAPEDNELVVAPTTPCVEALHDCIRALPHSLKAVFVLCDLQELSEEVAAQLLKIALTQISQYRRQARQHVRTCLRGKGWNEEGDEDA